MSTSAAPRRMKAVVAAKSGGPEVLQLTEVPVPRLRPGEVLVRVRAAGVNASDRHLRRSGAYVRLLRMINGAAIAGLEFAGVVAELGPSVGGLFVGDEVYGALPSSRNGGSYAEFVRTREEWIALKPKTLSFSEAAVAAVGGMTALEMLRWAGAERGGRVLVNGASGAIGVAAVQIARRWGCEVVGVCSQANADLVRSLGAALVLDYRGGGVRAAGPVDVFLDAGGTNADEVSAVLRAGGAYTTAVFDFRTVFRLRRRKFRATAAMVKPNSAALNELRLFAESGGLRIPLARTFSLSEAAQAQRELETGHPRGRIALAVAGEEPGGERGCASRAR